MAQPTPAEVAYMQAHITDDVRANVIAAECASFALAAIAVILRIVARYKKGVTLGADDYWIIVALVICFGYGATTLLMVHYGLGRHIILVTEPEPFTKVVVAGEVLYSAAIVPIKISVLYLYGRIFPSPRLRQLSIAVGGFVVAYSIAQCIAFGLQCIPLSAMWTGEPAQCIDLGKLVTACGVLNVFTDLILLAMPLPYLWQLKVSSATRAGLIFTFALGGCTTAFSIVRSVFVGGSSHKDASWNDVSGSVYSSLELNFGIVSACLPTLRGIFFPQKPASSSYRSDVKAVYSTTTDYELSRTSNKSPSPSKFRGFNVMVSQKSDQCTTIDEDEAYHSLSKDASPVAKTHDGNNDIESTGCKVGIDIRRLSESSIHSV